MKAIKWLVVALSVFVISCEQPVEQSTMGDNCYRPENQQKVCGAIRDDMERAWARCYDGRDNEQHNKMLLAIEIIYSWCMDQECLPEDTGLECSQSTWECVEFEGNQDLQVPWVCKSAIEDL